MNSKVLVIVGIVFLVVVGILWFMLGYGRLPTVEEGLTPVISPGPFGQISPTPRATSSPGAQASPTPPPVVESISVKTSLPWDNLITINQVTLKNAGFVVIHEDENGKPGKVISVSPLLQPPVNKGVGVVGSYVAGKSYIAVLHIDKLNGVFKEGEDPVAKDNKGNIVMAKFVIASQ